MNSPKAADAIFNKLCEIFKRHGTDEWIDGASRNAPRNPGLGQRPIGKQMDALPREFDTTTQDMKVKKEIE